MKKKVIIWAIIVIMSIILILGVVYGLAPSSFKRKVKRRSTLNIIIKPENKEIIEKTLELAQSKYKVRRLDYETLLKACKECEDYLNSVNYPPPRSQRILRWGLALTNRKLTL